MATLFVFISTLFSALVAMQGQQALTTKDQAGEQNHIFRLVGTGSMYKMQVPGLDEEAMCFDVDLYNARNKIVGPATGCLSDIQPKADGLSNTGTTFFYLPQGSIVTRGKISIQPVLDETAHESGQPSYASYRRIQ